MSKQRARRLKRWIAVIIAIAMAGCDDPSVKRKPPEYVFETVGRDEHMVFRIVKITNTKTGKTMKILKRNSDELMVLPEEF